MAVVEEAEGKVAADEIKTQDQALADELEKKEEAAFEQFVKEAKLGFELAPEQRIIFRENFRQSRKENPNYPYENPSAAPAEPAAPKEPKEPFKLSKVVPMVAMLGMQSFDPGEMGYTRHVEIGYIVVQTLCFAVLYYIAERIYNVKDDGIKIKIPEVTQMGQVVSAAKEQTAKEYDMQQLKENMKNPLLCFIVCSGIYYKWGVLMPLVFQILMMPLQLYEAPLTQIHIFGKEQKRPFGAPAAPEAEAPAVEEEAPAVEQKKEELIQESKKVD